MNQCKLANLLLSLNKPLMQIVFKCHDTCSILSVHGIPGILGWFVQLFLQLAKSESRIL